jgi:IMP dehydrogenase
VILGGLLAGCTEAPGEDHGNLANSTNSIAAWAHAAMKAGSAARYGHDKNDTRAKSLPKASRR